MYGKNKTFFIWCSDLEECPILFSLFPDMKVRGEHESPRDNRRGRDCKLERVDRVNGEE